MILYFMDLFRHSFNELIDLDPIRGTIHANRAEQLIVFADSVGHIPERDSLVRLSLLPVRQLRLCDPMNTVRYSYTSYIQTI